MSPGTWQPHNKTAPQAQSQQLTALWEHQQKPERQKNYLSDNNVQKLHMVLKSVKDNPFEIVHASDLTEFVVYMSGQKNSLLKKPNRSQGTLWWSNNTVFVKLGCERAMRLANRSRFNWLQIWTKNFKFNYTGEKQWVSFMKRTYDRKLETVWQFPVRTNLTSGLS